MAYKMGRVYDTQTVAGVNVNPSFEAWMWDEIEEHAEHGDCDLGRGEAQRKADKVQGDAGELLVKKGLAEREDIDIERVDGVEFDLLVNGEKIEVKSRKGWDSYKDLLVRTINGITADYYVQVIINRNPVTEEPVGGWITGFATAEEVKNADMFMPEKRNDSKIIKHEDLRDMDEFIELIRKDEIEV